MKYLMLVGILLANTTMAQTVINYSDGSTYTVKDNEKVYVTNKQIYTVRGGSQHAYFRFLALSPNEKRDHQRIEFTGEEQCWAWAGVAPPPGFSYEACFVEEQDEAECTPDGLSFGGGC